MDTWKAYYASGTGSTLPMVQFGFYLKILCTGLFLNLS